MSNQTSVYLLALLKVEDMASLQSDYAAPLQAINARHSVETVVATPKLELLEGTSVYDVAAVLRFPSRAALDAWYADPDYQSLITARHEATNTEISKLIVLTPMS